jgi:large subunit ribosomal protein L21
MYAVIENGGKQYRVELGAELELDQLTADPGAKIDIGRVLLVADGDDTMIGRPTVEGARVTAEVLRPSRGDKLIVFKYRPKARRRVKHGHRQDLTVVRIADIEFSGRSAAQEAQAEAEKAETARAEAAKAAAAKAKTDAALADKLAADKKAEKAQAATKAGTKPATTKTAGKPKSEAKAPAAKSAAKPKTPTPPAKRSTSSKASAPAPKKKKEE